MPFTVYFDDVIFDDEGDFEIKPESYSYEPPTLGDATGSADILGDQNTGLIGTLLGKSVPSYLKLRPEEKETLKVFLPAMKAAGVTRCVLAYDGGNDEGFGNLVSCHTADGSEITVDAVVANDAFMTTVEPFLEAAREVAKAGPFYREENALSFPDWAKQFLDYEIPVLTISLLLGSGYGTGEYQLYGRAFLDLEAMTITDDPKAPYPDGSSL